MVAAFFCSFELWHGNTVEPRYNEPLYNEEVLGITNNFLYPNNRKIYGKEL